MTILKEFRFIRTIVPPISPQGTVLAGYKIMIIRAGVACDINFEIIGVYMIVIQNYALDLFCGG